MIQPNITRRLLYRIQKVLSSSFILLCGFACLLTLGHAEPVSELSSIDSRGDCRGGIPEAGGATRQTGGTIEMTAYGSEFGHHCGQDQGHFAFTRVEGDFDVSVQIASLTNHGARRIRGQLTPAKGGLMVRENNDPAARYVAIWAVSNDDPDHYPDAYHFDVRRQREAWLGSQPEGDFAYGYINRKKHGDRFVRNYPNVWIRLKREGNTFSSFISRDGKSWSATSTPSFSLELPNSLHVGVALSSSPEGRIDARSTAKFQNLTGL
jgi:hypothetical protein